jgi:hypothetical protein
MAHLSDFAPQAQPPSSTSLLRDELARLKARYDSGAVPMPVFAAIRQIESELAWLEHREVAR